MRHLVSISILFLVFSPSFAHAKRGPKPKVNPIVCEGVRYSAHGDGRRGYVQASDSQTNRLLWEVTVFRKHYSPLALLGESDVLDVFIKQMFIEDGKLIVLVEDGSAFGVDLKNRKVKKVRDALVK